MIKLETKSYARNWNIRVSAVYFRSVHVLEQPETQPLLGDFPRYRKCHVMCFWPCTLEELYGRKWNITVWAVYWNDVWNSAILVGIALHLCLVFFRIIGFSFLFFFPRFSFLLFPFQENVICCSKCSYCNASDHRHRARSSTKTRVTPRFIVDS